MKIFSWILVVGGMGAAGWGWWGMFTVAGQHQYDEMDGLWPFLGLAMGGLATAVGLGCLAWKRYRR